MAINSPRIQFEIHLNLQADHVQTHRLCIRLCCSVTLSILSDLHIFAEPSKG